MTPPRGYRNIGQIKCRCINLWTDGRDYWCCQVSNKASLQALPPLHDTDNARLAITRAAREASEALGERDVEIARLRVAARQDAESLDRYRYAVAFAAAGGLDVRQRLEWARANDHGGELTNDRVAEIGKTFLEGKGRDAK